MTLAAAIRELFRPSETRSATKLSDPSIESFFGSGSPIFGNLDPERASRHSVALRCIAVQAENLAAVPLHLYRRGEDGERERATDHPLYSVLHDSPRPGLTAYECREFLIASVLVHGNGFARIERNGRGQVTALTPLDPRSVTVERLQSGRLRYRVSEPRGGGYTLLQEEALHLRYRLDRDGIMGLSPLRLASETMGTALAQNDQAGMQAKNSFRPAGALVFPEKLGKDQPDEVRRNFSQQMMGALNRGALMVLDGGVEFKPFSIPARDAEFLESRKLSNLDVCRVFGVPPTVVAITDHATYSNADQESRALVARCLAPLAKRVEQAMTTALISETSRGSLFIEHDLSGLLRGDQKARYEAYRIGREWGWLSPNEIRRWENLSKVDGGDEYLSPLNMTTLGAPRGEPGQDDE